MNPWEKPKPDDQREDMPRDQQRALADMCRFERLERFDAGYAASAMHLPELVHAPATVEALVRAGLVGRETAPAKGVFATLAGKHRNEVIAAARIAEPTQ